MKPRTGTFGHLDRAAAAAGAAIACWLWATPAAAEPELQDYRYFRALSIDLSGRLPGRGEIAAFEGPGFDLDAWIERRLTGPGYAERVERIYMDLLRLEVTGLVSFRPWTVILRRVKLQGPDGKGIYVYYRPGQRRTRTATDGVFCMTYAESGLQFKSNGQPTGTAIQVTQAVLDQNTTLVKPWWLYRDYHSASPEDRYDPAIWATEHPGFRPVDGLLGEPDGQPSMRVRVCKEEAQEPEIGTVYATGLTEPPAAGEPPPYGRLLHLPRDSKFATQNEGQPIECGSGTAFTNSADCGCGRGLERCMPGTSVLPDPDAFVVPTAAPLGSEVPFETAAARQAAWVRQAWAREASLFIRDIAAHDRDFRDILVSRATVVNGPAAQFHRFFSGAGCCSEAIPFGQIAPTFLTEPGAMPPLLPHDVNEHARVADRGPLAAGILTMPIFLTKYGTRRARAHVLYNVFSCKEFTSTNSELVPSEEPDLTKRSGCKDCHATLEPMAAHFVRVRENGWGYLPEAELPAENPACKKNDAGKIPSYCKPYYDPVFSTSEHGVLRGAHASPENADGGPAALAAKITGSDEFPRCVARNVAESFLGRPLSVDDEALHDELTSTFVQSGFRMRALVRALVKSDAYKLANDELGLIEQ